MSIEASQKAFISFHIKLDFFNNSNLKTDIQNRISDESEINFQNALDNIQGDNKETKGTDFSDLTLLAMAYFYERIFPKDTPIRNADYTINAVKGFFDACNHTPYTAIYEIDTTHHKLRDTALFRACYLVVQSAWFFNSEHFGRHQYLDYTSHYIKTGEQLPLDDYRHCKKDLIKQYGRIDIKKKKGTLPKGIPAYFFVQQWYYHIIFMIVRELGLNEKNFVLSHTKHREYNPSIKLPTLLRWETPFVTVHCDIKSAFPSFLDAITGSSIGQGVYENIMKRKGCSRPDAKRVFNTFLNSGKKDYWKKEKAFKDLRSWGYTSDQANHILLLTHDPERSFTEHMSEVEEEVIEKFVQVNGIKKFVRLHDAVLYIDNKIYPVLMNFEKDYIHLDQERPKNPVYTNRFSYSNKSLRFAHISSIPSATQEDYKKLIRKRILTNPEVKGEANGFRIYAEKYEYISASFNIADYYNYETFVYKCKEMISTLHYLNNEPITKSKLYLILCHIRQHSNIVFNVRYVYRMLLKHLNDIGDVLIQSRDFELTKRMVFRRDLDFLIAYNTAKGIVNKNYRLFQLFNVLDKRFSNNDFSFVHYQTSGRAKTDELTRRIILRINELTTGRKRKPKAQTLNLQPLYSNIYKEPASYLVEPHKFANQTRLAQRKIQVYERELIRINRLINNREIAVQYLHIIAEITGQEMEAEIQRDKAIIQAEKTFLMEQIAMKKYKTIEQGAKAFNGYLLPKPTEIKPNILKINDIETSLEHSAFNIEIDQAYHRGEQFFQEYLNFHKLDEKQNEVVKVMAKKEKNILPEIDFDEWA